VEIAGDDITLARTQLEQQGFREIEIVRDAMNAKIEASLPGNVWSNTPLEEKMKTQRQSAGPDAGRHRFREFLQTQGLFIGVLILWVLRGATSGHPWAPSSLLAYAAALGYVAFTIWLRAPAHLYDQLLQARVWHRWDEVMRMVARIRTSPTLVRMAVPEHELLFSEARALAGQGNLPAALEKVRPLESSVSLAPELYYGLLGSVYDAAGDAAGRVAASGKAVELAPKSPQARIDLAFPLAIYLRNHEGARAVLQTIDPANLVPQAKPYVAVIQGVMALDEGRPAEAEQEFCAAIEGWQPFSGNALAKSFGWLLAGFHAIALRRLGRVPEAEAEFSSVRPFFEATGKDYVLQRWDGK
jgi:hypothetical protein